jgi:RHS repeat-associated protein
LADSSGTVALAQGYSPFGQPLWSEGNGATGYGFTGERWEAYSQLLFLRARYYQPATGRFISQDPWTGSLHSPGTLNPYTYVENRVATRVDPSGLRSIAGSPIVDDYGFRVRKCGPGCWFNVSSHKFYSSLYYTPVEWEFPSPTDQAHKDFFNLAIPGTNEVLSKLTVHPDFWAAVYLQGGGRLDERNEPGEPYLPRGMVLRYHGGLTKNPGIAGGHPKALWTVAMDPRYLHLYGSLKRGDRICILELTSLTPYRGNFRYEDQGKVKGSPAEEYWLDIYVGEGAQSLKEYSFASTGKKQYRFTVLRAGRPGETCPCGTNQQPI